MAPVIVVALATLAVLITAVVLLVRHLGGAGHILPVTAEWIDDLSVDRYRPMLRLLDSTDLEFLRTQPGYSPRMESNLRAQRCQIFRGYLRSLNTDFRRVCMALKILMVQSSQDRPDLAAALVQHQILFASSMIAIQARLVFYRWGVCSVDVTDLIKIFDTLRMELRNLVPAAIPACA